MKISVSENILRILVQFSTKKSGCPPMLVNIEKLLLCIHISKYMEFGIWRKSPLLPVHYQYYKLDVACICYNK